MFEFTKKIAEYVKLGNAMDELYKQLDLLENQVESSNISAEYNEQLIGLSLIIRNEIISRLETYNWNMEGPISVTSIQSGNISLNQAFGTILFKLRDLSEIFESEIQNITEDIIEGGPMYHQLMLLSKKS